MPKACNGFQKFEKNIVISILTDNVKSCVHEINYQTHKRTRSGFGFVCSARTNGVILILGTYIAIFIIACVILMVSVLRLPSTEENTNLQFRCKENKTADQESFNLSTSKHVPKTFSRKFFKEFVWPYKTLKHFFNCSALSTIKKFTFISSGWTKSVFSFSYKDEHFALKTVNMNGKDMETCLKNNDVKDCYEKASSKMYKEYILSRELTHSNIVKVTGWCIGDDSSLENVAIVTELCSPVDTIFFLQMTFRQRLEVALQLAELVAYLSTSPLGSVALNDFQRQQFVLCGGTLKLTDLDDLSIEEPRCVHRHHCSQADLIEHLNLKENHTNGGGVECVNNACAGYNEKQNVMNMYRHFVSLFLPINVPSHLKSDVQMLLASYSLFDWDSKSVLKQTQDLYLKFNHSALT